MKKLLIMVSFVITTAVKADNQDPVEALKSSAHLAPGTVLYRWEADIEGNSRNVVFLDLDEDFHRKVLAVDDIDQRPCFGGFFFINISD